MGGGFDVPAGAPKKSIPTMQSNILNATRIESSSQSTNFEVVKPFKNPAGASTSTATYYHK